MTQIGEPWLPFAFQVDRVHRIIGKNSFGPMDGRSQAIVRTDEKEMGGATQAFETESINRVAVSSAALYRCDSQRGLPSGDLLCK
jgi:hypothetical protein